MEDDKLKIGIKEIKEIKMTDLERDHIYRNILSSPVISYTHPVKSPWAVFSFMATIHKNRFVYYGSVLGLFVVLGGGAVFASGNSLPGNIFYPLKVSVIEPLYSTLTFSPKAKAQYESHLATKRLVEAETLKIQGKLDKKKEERLNLLLENHTESFSKAIDDIKQEKLAQKRIDKTTDDNDDDTVTNFQAEMKAHARVLDFISGQDDKSEKQEKNIKISETARTNASKIRDTLNEDKDDEKGGDEGKNEERKKHVKEIIDSTTRELERHTSSDLYPTRRRIIDDTHKTLKEADQFLKEAEEENERGDSKKAYFKLLDSESSAKEAGIFLKTGLKFKEDENEKGSKDREEERD
ncbi:MAG: hypothetical protein WA060_03465 [Minisyncoccia bacterium]